jgi:hypothetical protein
MQTTSTDLLLNRVQVRAIHKNCKKSLLAIFYSEFIKSSLYAVVRATIIDNLVANT